MNEPLMASYSSNQHLSGLSLSASGDIFHRHLACHEVPLYMMSFIGMLCLMQHCIIFLAAKLFWQAAQCLVSRLLMYIIEIGVGQPLVDLV